MNEFLFYFGIVLFFGSLILGIILFFTQKIPTVIRFILKNATEKTIKSQDTENTLDYTSKVVNDSGTDILNDQTDLLNMDENFETDLLNLLDIENAHNYKEDKNVID